MSGSIVNTSVEFLARGSLQQPVLIEIMDDDVGFENDEIHEVQLADSNPSDRVMLGRDTRIIIRDDDC